MRTIVACLVLFLLSLAPRIVQAAEDPCIGESASSPIAVCTDVEVSEWKVRNSWDYDFGGPWASYIMECEARGGVMGYSIILGQNACSGAADWTEGNFVSMAQAIAAKRFQLTGAVEDTGYYSNPDGELNCRPTVKFGFITRECRDLKIHYNQGNGTTSYTRFNGGRSREVRCPNGYLPIDTPAGPRCKLIICDATCQAGSGPRHPSLANVRREPVYGKPGSMLNFDRVWTSQGAFNPGDGQIGPGPGVGQMNHGWSHSFDKRLSPAGDRIGVLASIQAPDGTVVFYGLDGFSVQAVSGVRERLQQVSGAAPWRLVKRDGSTEHYNAAGRLTAISTRGPERIDITYANDRIDAVVDHQGRALRFVHDASGNMVRAELPDGEAMVFKYTLRGVLESITHSDGSVRSFVYGDDLMLEKVIDEAGKYTAFDYSSAGQLRQVSSGAYRYADRWGSTSLGWLESTSLSYNPTHSFTTETDGIGGITYRTYAPVAGVMKPTVVTKTCTGCTARTSVYTYDAAGRLKTSKGPKNELTFLDYDTEGRVIRRFELATVVNGAVTAYGRRQETDWHPLFNVPTEARTYDANNVLVSRRTWTYNAAGQSLTSSQVDPGTGAARTTTYAYCSASDVAAANSTCPILGLPKSVDGPRSDVNDTTTLLYRSADDLSGCDTGGACHRKGDLWKVVGPDGRTETMHRYDRAGRLTESSDANGVRTTHTYNARGWLTARAVLGADDGATSDDAVTGVEYDAAGLVKRIVEPDGESMTFTYDVASRLTSIRDGLGNSIVYTLDATGNRVKEDTLDTAGTLQRNLSRVFTKFGEVKTLADSQAIATDFTYDVAGNQASMTDALGRVSTMSHDPLGRLREAVGNSAGAGSERAVSQFDYDALDNVSAVIDPKGLTTTYGRNGLGDLVQLTSPDTGTTTFDYDSAGNRIRQVDARGVETVYDYDASGRLALMRSAPSQPGGGNVLGSFTYDSTPAVCDPGQGFSAGRLSGFVDPSGNTAYCHDHRGNVVRKVQSTEDGRSRSLDYAYTAGDRIREITYPSGMRVTYTRNAAGQVTGVSARMTERDLPVDLVTAVDYRPFGPLSRLVFGNGRVLDKNYDLDYGIASVADSAADGLAIGYSLDDVGNVTGLSERQNGGAIAARTVQYDGLDRLMQLADGTTTVQGFTYDATGNRTQKVSGTTANYVYAADSHRLTKVGTVNRTYDATGNSTAIGSRNYVYDDRGRMSQSRNGATVLRDYRYNALGQRVAKIHPTAPASTIYFVYDEAGKLMGEYKPDGTIIKEYLWLDDTLVAVRGGYAGHKFQYVLTDHLGTPRAVVLPSSNAIIWRWDLTTSAFGDHTAQNNPDGDTYNYVFNLRYPGQYFDSETGLHYNYFRDYEPGTGRYVQSDPIGLEGGSGTFVYAENSPVLYADPDGLRARPNPWNQFQQANAHRGWTQAQMRSIYRQVQLNRMGGPRDLDLHEAVSNLPDMATVKCNSWGYCSVEVEVCKCGAYGPFANSCAVGPVAGPLPQDNPACYCRRERAFIF